ncbi:MAG: tyrosine-type recombinase/integrase, partial [Alphaproteobacteria bacterium]
PHSPEFWQAYAELSGREPEAPASGTFDALIEAYKASPEFKAKSDRTKQLNESHLAIISTAWGSQLVRGVRPRHVLELRDTFENTPRKADQIVALLSVIIGWGIPRDFADQNPCQHIGKLSKTDGYAPWSWPDIEHAREHLPLHLWHVAALALYTGQRQSDVLKMDWGAVKDGGVELRQGKTGKRLWIPLHRNLRLILDGIPRSSTRILTNSHGLPWASGFKAAWQGTMNSPKFEHFRERRLVFHGLRKSAVVMLLEAGCTDAEVAAITGQTRDMVAHYSLMVNQRKLAAAAILKWEAANGP